MSALKIKRDTAKGNIWSHIRSKWLVETPEETVRQNYWPVLDRVESGRGANPTLKVCPMLFDDDGGYQLGTYTILPNTDQPFD